MKAIIIYSLFVFSFLLVSCNKAGTEIDLSTLNDEWVVAESDESFDDGLFVAGDKIKIEFNQFHGAPSEVPDQMTWFGKRGNIDIQFWADIDKDAYKIWNIYGYPNFGGNDYLLKFETEYRISTLNNSELILDRVTSTNKKGKVILKRE